MQTITNKYLAIYPLSDIQGLKIQWLPDSVDMTDEEFRQSILMEKEAIESIKPRAIFADTLQMRYTIVPKLQDWHNSIITPAFEKAGTKKLGILVSEDLFTQVSIEQLVEDMPDNQLQTRYFTDETSALQWLRQ